MNPRNMGALPDADVTAEAADPCCGDRLRLYARLDGDRVAECTFLAYGCAATVALGSMLTEVIVGGDIHDLPEFDEGRLIERAGGLSPGQRHAASLANDALRSLVRKCRVRHPKGVRA